MTRVQFVLLAALITVMGLIGGITSNWLFTNIPAFAQNVGGHNKVITAEQFQLVDDTGKVWAELRSDRGRWYGLYLFDKSGQARTVLATDRDGRGELTYFDSDKRRRASFLVDEGGPILRLMDKEGNARVGVSMHNDRIPGIGLYDQQGKTVTALVLTDDGTPMFETYDKQHRRRILLTMIGDAGPGITFLDKEGKSRALIGADDNGNPYAALLDKTGKALWSVP